MKNPIALSTFTLITAALLWLAQTAFVKPVGDAQKVQWNETTHNFGDIPIGPNAVAKFTFKNKGKDMLVVKSVEPGCSCTISSYTSEPVKKNKKGSVTATYRTEGRPGFFKKFIKVTFENGQTSELIITGNVVETPKL